MLGFGGAKSQECAFRPANAKTTMTIRTTEIHPHAMAAPGDFLFALQLRVAKRADALSQTSGGHLFGDMAVWLKAERQIMGHPCAPDDAQWAPSFRYPLHDLPSAG
jgi:hypothetical protein